MKKKGILIAIVLVLVVAIFIIYSGSGSNNKVSATVYKSPTCGCCVKYIPYAESKGFEIGVQTTTYIDPIKAEYGIPSSMQSCHTMVVDDYFVEGHVPIKAVEKLLEERPDIDGIALPGMPAGSPGMPGTKQGDFVIYAVKGGQVSEFMRI
ncbi:DUF411 domain-containing protein [Nanoarchaeota archaeon]